MSTARDTASANIASTATNKAPSPPARKLLQKLATLHPNASLESRQTISNWMLFNRKKCEGMGEGLLLAVEGAAAIEDRNEASARLLLLLRITHQVFLSNCPTVTVAGPAGASADADKWMKSSQLRSRLGDIVILPLWKALATSLRNLDEETQVQYQSEVKEMMEEWKTHNVFGGPTVLEEYKRGWIRALKEAAGVTSGEDSTLASAGEAANSTATAMEKKADVPKQPLVQARESTTPNESNQHDDAENAQKDTLAEKPGPTESIATSGEGRVAQATKRDSIKRQESTASVDLEVDFEGVDEATVPPARFLDACKVIASIQITRDLGSDFAMSLSSTLSSIPPAVEQACATILTQRKNKQEETPLTDLVPSDVLSTLPEDFLSLDFPQTYKDLQKYKETIRQQRKARLQCLQLLLESRCSFGSMEAARSFSGGDGGDGGGGGDVNMKDILNKLTKRKEILVDAMALEGLDVEEDAEEKKMEKEEALLTPLSWFTEAENDKVSEEPAAKKLKT